MKIILAALAFAATAAILVLPGWERPPMVSTQTGFRGTGMELVQNPRTLARLAEANQVPEAQPPADLSGQKASAVYQNVKVLGDLDEGEFNRLMAAITEWVSPEEGCTYCHNPENLAEDSVYTKVVARRMLQMTASINKNWDKHVGQTGVTCWTCHRGNPVPKQIWFKGDGAQPTVGMFGYHAGQNMAGANFTSLPMDPYSAFLSADNNIRVEGPTALPTDAHKVSVKDAEKTYSLMMQMSNGLGVNCTFCHNTRAIANWSESTPQRVTAWHGIRMVRDVNNVYIDPLQPVFPPNRLGPHGDVAKVFCATCHQGQNKPMNGAQMLKDYLTELGTVKQD